jgi:hypothetical protein
MSEPIILTPPLSDEDVVQLKAGERVLITGTIYTGRDAAHKRLVDWRDRSSTLSVLLRRGLENPLDRPVQLQAIAWMLILLLSSSGDLRG